MARGELHVQLSVDYADNPKIIAAGEKAELLYLRALCLAKRTLSDGMVYANQLPRFGLPGVQARARQLIDVGLWEERPGGYYITGYLERNKSKEQVLSDRKKDRDRKDSGRNPSGIREPETETQSDAESESSVELGFQEFWDAYPTRKGGRAAALKGWKARRREGVLAEDMTRAAENYAARCQDKETAEEFIMQGATFLGPNLRFEEYLARWTPAPAIERNRNGERYVGPKQVELCPDCDSLKANCTCGVTLHNFTKARAG